MVASDCCCDKQLLAYWPLPRRFDGCSKRTRALIQSARDERPGAANVDLALQGCVLWGQGRTSDAIVVLRLALERDQTDVVALLGVRYLLRGAPSLLPLPQVRDLDTDLLCCAQRASEDAKFHADVRLASKPKSTACVFLLGTLRDVVMERVQEGRPLYEKAAKAGFLAAKFNLGRCYFDGEGVEKDVARAVKLFMETTKPRKAYPPGLCMLGLCYEQGRGVPCDPRQAAKLYESACRDGLSMAETNLGWCYANGSGVEKDFKRAAQLYQLAAMKGLARAQTNLGFAFGYGEGFQQDIRKAVFWNRRAGDQGNPAALYYLAWCYEHGRPFARDRAEAVRLYRKAADQGVGEAHSILQRLCPAVHDRLQSSSS